MTLRSATSAPSSATTTEPSFSHRAALVIFIGLQLGQVMSSLDGTIVATALPTIVDDVGGLSRVTWVVTGYTLAVVAVMPLYGKLGDLYGRRRIFLGAIAIFLAGSMACGAAQTMDQLLVARFVQGMGGGGLGALAMATIADIVPARNLGRWLGYQGVIFAIASVAGPFVGGLFVDHLSWRWAFFVNVPVGTLAALIVASRLRLPPRRVEHRLDIAGSVLLTAALACLVLVATLGGHEIPWTSVGLLGLVLATVVLGVAFVQRERRAAEPVMPLHLFTNRVLRVSAGINFTSGLMFWCGIIFVPLFVQEVRGVSPTRSGLTLMPLMFGAAFGTLLTGRWLERSGRVRIYPIIGGVMATVSLLLLATMDASTTIAFPAAYSLLLGLGCGFMMQPSLLAAQNALPYTQLGIATSTALLCRSLGSTVGTPIFGGLLNGRLADLSSPGPADFADALPVLFAAAVPVGVACILISWRLRDEPLREHTGAAEPVPAPAD